MAGLASANTVIVIENGGTDAVFGVTGFTLTGNNMAALGLTINVHFATGASALGVLWTTGCVPVGTCGFATGAVPGGGNWTLTQVNDTGAAGSASNPDGTAARAWTLTNTSTTNAITSIDLLGGSNIVFDIDRHSAGQEGTPGSNFGIDYTFANEGPTGNVYTVTVTYLNRVTITQNPSTPCVGSFFPGTVGTGCGDLWNNVTFTFTGGPAFQATGSGVALWAFFQDTDAVGIPEPMSLVLTGAGLIGLVAYGRRRLARPRQ